MKRFFVSSSLFLPILAFAQLNAAAPRGAEKLEFNAPNGVREICVLPQHSGLGAYSEKDMEDEKELCSYDFHALTSGRDLKQMALCPKLNSSNPGVLVMDIPKGWERNQFESQKCLIENDLQKTQAKFKQSITCSYTPSILAYYHFSRFLDGAGRVPVAVLRTLEKGRHLKVALEGYRGTTSPHAIHAGWGQLKDAHASDQNPLLFDSRREVIFGALQSNIKNEGKYYDMIGGGKYEERYNNFVKLPVYQQLKDSREILNVLGSNQFAKVANAITLLKDTSDMIVLDTLLTQQDRMYNQHFKWTWTWLENGEIERKRVGTSMDLKGGFTYDTKGLKPSTAESEREKQREFEIEKKKFASKNAVLVRELIMKDNDCGTRANFYRNRMNDVKALDGIRHISGKTYTALIKLARNLRNPAMLPYLKNETLMSDADLNMMLKNTTDAATKLQNKCRSGELKLDLDLETYFTSSPEQYSCDI